MLSSLPSTEGLTFCRRHRCLTPRLLFSTGPSQQQQGRLAVEVFVSAEIGSSVLTLRMKRVSVAVVVAAEVALAGTMRVTKTL